MPDPFLNGNGTVCPSCAPQEAMFSKEAPGPHHCTQCGGTGRLARATTDIIADHVAWARENYWPDLKQRK